MVYKKIQKRIPKKRYAREEDEEEKIIKPPKINLNDNNYFPQLTPKKESYEDVVEESFEEEPEPKIIEEKREKKKIPRKKYEELVKETKKEFADQVERQFFFEEEHEPKIIEEKREKKKIPRKKYEELIKETKKEEEKIPPEKNISPASQLEVVKNSKLVEQLEFHNGKNILSIRYSERTNRMFRIQVFLNNEIEIRPMTYVGSSSGNAFWNLLKGAMKHYE